MQVVDEFVEGVVTKGMPSSYRSSSYNNSNSRRDEGHGLIEVAKQAEAEEGGEDAKDAATGEGETAEAPVARKVVVRFNNDSVTVPETDSDKNQDDEASQNRQKGGRSHVKLPRFGDEVRFRIATHRKTGVKRAVNLTVTVSAKEKLDKEIEQRLATMERELGIVDRIKAGGGFIKCCDRQDDVYFPFHEVQEDDASGKEGETGTSHGHRPSKSSLREGDEVSFYVYEDQDDESGRSRSRLTALRVQKLPKGTVSFEELIRSDVEGTVTKVPKEPRNGPEIQGIITLDEQPVNDVVATDENAAAAATEEAAKDDKPKKKGLLKKKKKATVPFRLSDAEDMSYQPASGDRVVFDEILEKRSGKRKAIHVRVLELNPKNRETGVISALKDDFGFIKCAERPMDAYFRFTDVMTVRNDFRSGTEVSFDVSIDSSRPDSARATRIQILPHGTIQWETIVAEELAGEVTVTPSKRTNNPRGGNVKLLQKGHNGRIQLSAPEGKFMLDFLPDLKNQVDSAFIAADASDLQEDEDIRLEFPSFLSKYERALIHEYCDWLGIKHESEGDKYNRHLVLVAKGKLLASDVASKDEPRPRPDIEFKMEDVADVRYDPHVGDEVKFQLGFSKRTKQFLCKAIVCVKATAPQKKTAEPKETPKAVGIKAEGFIATIKSEGFGFIRPANKGAGVEENVFFHVNAIVSGERLDDLEEGMEVQYTVSYDDKKKKSRAVNISIVPAGTIKEVEVQSLRGVVSRASILQRMKGARFNKTQSNKPMSTVGKIRAVSGQEGADGEADAANDDEDDNDAEDVDVQDESDGAGEDDEKPDAAAEEPNDNKKSAGTKTAAKTKKDNRLYFYHIQDVVDHSVVLREGDEIEFLPQATAKGMRATKIKVIASHSVEGIVVSSDDLGGIIRIDGDDAVEARFGARNVLRGDILKEGDRVEFAYRRPAPPSKKQKKKAAASTSTEGGEAGEAEAADGAAEGAAEGVEVARTESVLGQATSVLRISSSTSEMQNSSRREARSVNSTLLQAMRQVGVNAMVASRMAKGPDGTRGFTEGWRSDLLNATSPATSKPIEAEAVTTESAAEAAA